MKKIEKYLKNLYELTLWNHIKSDKGYPITSIPSFVKTITDEFTNRQMPKTLKVNGDLIIKDIKYGDYYGNLEKLSVSGNLETHWQINKIRDVYVGKNLNVVRNLGYEHNELKNLTVKGALDNYYNTFNADHKWESFNVGSIKRATYSMFYGLNSIKNLKLNFDNTSFSGYGYGTPSSFKQEINKLTNVTITGTFDVLTFDHQEVYNVDVLEDGVYRIGNQAMHIDTHSAYDAINFNKNVKSIQGRFLDIDKMSGYDLPLDINIPNTVKRLSYNSFYGYKYIQNVYIDNSKEDMFVPGFNRNFENPFARCKMNSITVINPNNHNLCYDCNMKNLVVDFNNHDYDNYLATWSSSSLSETIDLTVLKNLNMRSRNAIFGSYAKVKTIKITNHCNILPAFYNSIECLDLSEITNVPLLNSSWIVYLGFAISQIKVPQALYEDFITATNWCNFKSIIVAV